MPLENYDLSDLSNLPDKSEVYDIFRSDKQPPLPTLYNNYKLLLFTNDNEYCKKFLLTLCLPISLIIDIFMFIPRNIKKKINNYKLGLKYKLI